MNTSARSLCAAILIGMTLSSCGSMKKLPEEPASLVVGRHMSSGDLPALLSDMSTWPAYKSEIREHLMRACDYSESTYLALDSLASAADDWELAMFYDSLKSARQQKVLGHLDTLSLPDVAAYYSDYSTAEPYLHDVLSRAFFHRVDTLDYHSLRDLHLAFRGTDLDSLVESRYSLVRFSLIREVDKDVRQYFDAEDRFLEAQRLSSQKEMYAYVQKAVSKVVEKALIKLDRGIFKRTFKRDKNIDGYKFTELLFKTLKESVDTSYIKNSIIRRSEEFVSTSNARRSEYLSEYLPGGAACLDRPDVGSLMLKSWDGRGVKLGFPMSEEYVEGVQIIRELGYVISGGSILLSFIPGIGVIGAAGDILDLIYGMNEDSLIKEEIDSMAETLTEDACRSIDNYINSAFDPLASERTSTATSIINIINAEF